MQNIKHYTVNSISWVLTASVIIMLSLGAILLAGWFGLELLAYLMQA